MVSSKCRRSLWNIIGEIRKGEHEYKNHVIPYNLEFRNKPRTSQPSSCRRTANHTGWHEGSSFYTFQPGDHMIGQETGLQKTKEQ